MRGHLLQSIIGECQYYIFKNLYCECTTGIWLWVCIYIRNISITVTFFVCSLSLFVRYVRPVVHSRHQNLQYSHVILNVDDLHHDWFTWYFKTQPTDFGIKNETISYIYKTIILSSNLWIFSKLWHSNRFSSPFLHRLCFGLNVVFWDPLPDEVQSGETDWFVPNDLSSVLYFQATLAPH